MTEFIDAAAVGAATRRLDNNTFYVRLRRRCIEQLKQLKVGSSSISSISYGLKKLPVFRDWLLAGPLQIIPFIICNWKNANFSANCWLLLLYFSLTFFQVIWWILLLLFAFCFWKWLLSHVMLLPERFWLHQMVCVCAFGMVMIYDEIIHNNNDHCEYVRLQMAHFFSATFDRNLLRKEHKRSIIFIDQKFRFFLSARGLFGVWDRTIQVTLI